VRSVWDGGTSVVGGVRILVRRVLARVRCLDASSTISNQLLVGVFFVARRTHYLVREWDDVVADKVELHRHKYYQS